MNKYKSPYKLGQNVIIAESIPGWIDSIEFIDGMSEPTYHVRYWINGNISREAVKKKDIQGLQ